ncbi:General substrate transporter domain containing protein [Aphelenchoides besseyi]|nr:General substrate transporter domain containing protein [Aphelenchoides besseyi]
MTEPISVTSSDKTPVTLVSEGADPNKPLLDPKVATETLNPSTDRTQPEGRLTTALLFAVFASTIGSSFQFGYHIGCVNNPSGLIQAWYNESNVHLHNRTLSVEEEQRYWSISVSIFAVGGMIGGLLNGWFADRFGRKGALLLNNIIVLIATALMSLAKPFGVWYMIPVGRFVVGLACGLASGLVPMYLTEISPSNYRGTLGSVHQLLVTISILFGQILGLPYIFGTANLWPFIFAFSVIPSVIQLATLVVCPESPKHNLINRNNADQAEKDLKKLRGESNVSAELDIINEEAQAARSQPKVTFAEMFRGSLRWPLFIAVMMMFSQQFSGINAAMFYSTEIFKSAGLNDTNATWATIGMGCVNVLQTIVSLWLVDHPKFGRRSLHLAGLTGMFFSSILIVVSLSVAGIHPGGHVDRPWAAYASIAFVLLFVISFATGPGSIPWFFVSEIFPSSARGNANSIAVMANWTANFIVALSFLQLNELLHQYTFLVFAGLLAFFIVFLFKYMTETKNREYADIQKEMAGRR